MFHPCFHSRLIIFHVLNHVKPIISSPLADFSWHQNPAVFPMDSKPLSLEAHPGWAHCGHGCRGRGPDLRTPGVVGRGAVCAAHQRRGGERRFDGGGLTSKNGGTCGVNHGKLGESVDVLAKIGEKGRLNHISSWKIMGAWDLKENKRILASKNWRMN